MIYSQIQSVHLLKVMLVTVTNLAHSVSQRHCIPAVLWSKPIVSIYFLFYQEIFIFIFIGLFTWLWVLLFTNWRSICKKSVHLVRLSIERKWPIPDNQQQNILGIWLFFFYFSQYFCCWLSEIGLFFLLKILPKMNGFFCTLTFSSWKMALIVKWKYK